MSQLLVVPAQSSDAEQVRAAASALPPHIQRQIRERPERFLKNALQAFSRFSLRDAIEPIDFDRVAAIDLARTRAQMVAGVMRHDIDGNREVTQTEYLLGAQGREDRATAAFQEMVRRADADGNGALDLAEINADALSGIQTPNLRRSGRDLDLRQFDVNGDGTVSRHEIRIVITAVAGRDPVASAPVKRQSAIVTRRKEAPEAPAGPPPGVEACKPPAVPAGAKVILLHGDGGSAISPLAANGTDSLTTVGTIVIEPGDQPFYIYAVAMWPVIWRITGATERVAHLVAEPRGAALGPGVGVVGLPGERVSFLSAGACAQSTSKRRHEVARAAHIRLAWALGLPVKAVRVVSAQKLDMVRVPSGEVRERYTTAVKVQSPIRGNALDVTSSSRGFGSIAVRSRKKGEEDEDPKGLPNARGVPESSGNTISRPAIDLSTTIGRMEELQRERFPEGVAALDPSEVLAPGPLEQYDVLPGNAGLLRLIKTGALREAGKHTYRLSRPIPHFPSMLERGPLFKILIPRGIPVPDGSPGRLSVYLEATGECVSRYCR